MSMLRSPNKDSKTGVSESFPDLRNLPTMEQRPTLRKRKQPEEEFNFKEEFQNFRKEILQFLSDFKSCQSESTDRLSQEINDLKTDLGNLKTSMENILAEQYAMKTKIENVIEENLTTKNRIEILEKNLKELEVSKNTDSEESLYLNHEKLIMELKERASRETNIIIFGIPENTNSIAIARQDYDLQQVLKHIKGIYADCPQPLKLFRLGRYRSDNHRPIKVCFTSRDTVMHILRNKSNMSKDIRVYSDQTPMQRDYYNKIRNELQNRQENGESNLTIKYINGIPKIMKSTTKN